MGRGGSALGVYRKNLGIAMNGGIWRNLCGDLGYSGRMSRSGFFKPTSDFDCRLGRGGGREPFIGLSR